MKFVIFMILSISSTLFAADAIDFGLENIPGSGFPAGGSLSGGPDASLGGFGANQFSSNKPTQRRRSADVSFLPNRGGQCAFEPQLGADDLSLLENAQRTIKVLRENDKCKALVPQMDAFEKSMRAYSSQAGLDRAPGYDGQININCSNYQDIYDLENDFFVNTWDETTTNMTDPFSSCRGLPQQDALDCAAKVTGAAKANKKHQCEISESSVSAAQEKMVLADTYKTSLEMLQAVINNDECIDSTGDQKISFIQSAVSLAGRAASIGSVGTESGLLIGVATDLVGTLVDKIFRSTQKSKDNLMILENRNNFTKIACLYEQLESKSRRCDRISASREVEATERSFIEAKSCVDNGLQGEILSKSALVGLSDMIQALKPQATASTPPSASPEKFNQEMFDQLAQKFNTTFPGTDDSLLAVSEQSANEVVLKLKDTLASDENLKQYLLVTEKKQNPSGTDLRQLKNSLLATLNRASSVHNVLMSIKNADSKGTQTTAEDIKNVEVAMNTFAKDSGNFISAYNEIMIARATLFPDDLASKISAYNMRITQADAMTQVIDRYNSKKAQSESGFQDNGNFSDATAGIRPHLKLLLDQELDVLVNRARELSDIKPGVPSTALKEQMRTKEEEVLYPILRACNQLRSVMNIEASDIDTKNEHEACSAFNCDQGTPTFDDYLTQNGLPKKDSEECENTSCQAQYSRYICQVRTKLPGIRNNLQNEFLSKGTICGKPMSRAFKK